MIYLFKGCGAVCSAPFKCCDAACKEISKACDDCCKCFESITKAPLATYVLGTIFCMAIVILGSGWSLTKVKCNEPKMFCMAICALGAIHMAFAIYIQRRLVCLIGKEESYKMSFKEIAAKAKELMLYDVAFCLYVPVFIGSFCYCLYGGGDSLEKCDGTGPAWGASALLAMYGFCVGNYAMCWFCCQNCCSAAEDAKAQMGMGPKAAKVGAGGP